MANDLIDSTEMYLRTVLELHEEGIPALRARLADRLGLSAPSVSEGVARLVREDLLEMAEDRTVTLTERGRAIAESVMRKHRLAERLLVDVLGIEREFVHEEACRWEHVISDRVEEKLIAFLGSPDRSPYGNPIPGYSEAADGPQVSLAEHGVGVIRIERISERLQADHELMGALDRAGLSAGDVVEVTATVDGLRLEAGGGVAVSDEASRFLYVTPATS